MPLAPRTGLPTAFSPPLRTGIGVTPVGGVSSPLVVAAAAVVALALALLLPPTGVVKVTVTELSVLVGLCVVVVLAQTVVMAELLTATERVWVVTTAVPLVPGRVEVRVVR